MGRYSRGFMAKREPEACMPCRGTGSVISSLGGEQRSLTCPWCGGEGVRHSGGDAQAAWAEGGEDGKKAAAGAAADAAA
jgi:DnaJ-class molecular chaperone